ncbi:hypothetical protein B7463_g5801, partial [Scytalidium lignicola]
MQLFWVSLLAASAIASSTKPWVRYFDNLVTFGDSYTDENRLGYFISHNGQAPPPGLLLPESTSTPGGGITWDRWVSKYTGAMLFNYAVSGAVCSNEITPRWFSTINAPFPDVIYEVNAFVADAHYINATTGTNTLYTKRRSDNTVYSIFIGTNDLGNDAFLTDSQVAEKTIPNYVDCIFDRFDTLYENGARYLVVMNTAPLELSPQYGLPGAGGVAASHYFPDKPANITEISGKMKEYTKLVNAYLNYRVPFELQIKDRYPGAQMAIFDINSLMTYVYHNPGEFFTSPVNVTGFYYHCDVATGSTCTPEPESLDHFMWYDELHPSQTTDEAIAHEFVKLIQGTSKYATYWHSERFGDANPSLP